MARDDELWKSWMRLCKDPRTSAELLEKAAYWESINDPNHYEIRLAIARHRTTTSDLLTKLSMIKHLAIQISVAGHPNLSEKTAVKILKSQLRELRRALAGNPKIPLFVMEKLAKDYKDVRVRLAKNVAIPRSLMMKIASERDPQIRIALTKNQSLHHSILERLSKDKDVAVRLAVVDSESIPISGLREMAGDPSDKVREAVFNRAMDDFPTDVELFRILAKGKKSVLAQDAKAHLDHLLTAEHVEAVSEEGIDDGSPMSFGDDMDATLS
ncbi:MAG: hypothetical protein QNK37_02415 [Acidobacteriota bacterium]|nr:hypothetical protein [Acidobacteriota bacterium]